LGDFSSLCAKKYYTNFHYSFWGGITSERHESRNSTGIYRKRADYSFAPRLWRDTGAFTPGEGLPELSRGKKKRKTG
jgi:hypothetical protein